LGEKIEHVCQGGLIPVVPIGTLRSICLEVFLVGTSKGRLIVEPLPDGIATP
jgi:hypothetical protein